MDFPYPISLITMTFLRDGLKAGQVLKIPAAPDISKEMVKVDSAPAGIPCTTVK